MGVEIERKFLVNKEAWKALPKAEGQFYRQGYITTDATKTVRVRLAENTGFLTIKGLSDGLTRPEYEYIIPAQEAKELLDNFCSSDISKIRYKVSYHGKLWEVDEFLGDNEGLIVAEIELASEQETFELPLWIDKEVTGMKKYYNACLSVHPFQHWPDETATA